VASHSKKLTNQLDLFESLIAEPHKAVKDKIQYKNPETKNKDIEKLVDSKETFSSNEKEFLSQYAGAGGLANKGAEGAGLLDEYYTPKAVTRKLWEILGQYLPDRTLSIIEPSAGTGNFFANAPENSKLYYCETNPTSRKIVKTLYPNAHLLAKHFEDNFISERGEKLSAAVQYDVVIGNPPFGQHRGAHKGLGEEPKISRYEQYFVKRGLDIAKTGGFVAYVMPSGFLRGAMIGHAKEEIATSGELVTAYRLPASTFKTTEIGTDIVIFRKNPIETGSGEYFNRLNLISNNNFFIKYPENVMGVEKERTARWGKEKYIDGDLSQFLDLTIKRAKELFPIDVTETPEEIAAESDETKEDEKRIRQNSIQKNLVITNQKNDDIISLTDKNVSSEELATWNNTTALGYLETSYISKLFTDMNINDVKQFFHSEINISFSENGNAVYFNNFNYFQGDIYEKLEHLKSDKHKLSVKQYDKQLSGLNKILPPHTTINRIKFSPQDILIHDFQCSNGATLLENFQLYAHDLPDDAFMGSNHWEIDDYLDHRPVYGGDKILNARIRSRRRKVAGILFNKFIQNEITVADKQKLENHYNRSRNAIVMPDYSLPPLTAPAYSYFKERKLELRSSQIYGSGFVTNKGLGCLAHEVGGGKTLAAIIAVNEALNKKWSKRPLIIVPRSIYKKWIYEIMEVIPGIKINSLGNLGKKYEEHLKDFAIEDGSITIITVEGLNRLGFKKETYTQLSANIHDVMSIPGLSKRAQEKSNAKIDEITGKAKRGTKKEFSVEDFGFDTVVFDEAHRYKNIFAAAKMAKGQANEYAAVRGGNSSARGVKAFFLSQYILSKNNDRGVILLTATPFTNSPMEYYSMLSLLAKKRLEKIGFTNVNDFMAAFMDLKSTFVLKADRTLKQEEVIERFKNAKELKKLINEFFDFRSGEQLGLERPNKIRKTISLKPTSIQTSYMAQAEQLFDDKNAGGTIVGITEMQNITLSPYLSRFCSTAPENYKTFVESSPKIHFILEAINQVKKERPGAGQIFHMSRGVAFHPLVKEYLINEYGYKEDEVAIISGKINSSPQAIEKIQANFNAGKIKVLIGSDTIKEGIDLQNNTTDLYSAHLPWNPLDLDQLEGRLWRCGNTWTNVRVTYPLIENSVDPFIFQKLETKEKRIKDIRTNDNDEIDVSDIDFEVMKLDLITDPVLKVEAEKTLSSAKLNQEYQTLLAEKALLENDINRIAKIESKINDAEEELKSPEYHSEHMIKLLKNRVVSGKKNLILAKEKSKIINIDKVKKKISVLSENIKVAENNRNKMHAQFAVKLEKAENSRSVNSLNSIPNDFTGELNKIKEENKTLLIKVQKQKPVIRKNKKTGMSM